MAWKPAGREQKLDSTRGLASLIFPASVAVMIPFLSPVIVGGLVDAAGWSERQAGLLISVEMGAFAWSGVAGVMWLNRAPWRVVSLAACALLLAANLASCFVVSEAALMGWRTVSGIGAGTLIALCYGALARTRKPHRNYAIFSMNQMALAIVCLAFLPVAINGNEGDPNSMAAVVLGALGITRALGMNAFFTTMLVLGLLGTICVALWIPTRPEKPQTPPGKAAHTNWLFAIAMLVAIFALMVSQQGLWTYAERIGVSADISRSSVAGVLTLGALAGLVGASTASAVGDRFVSVDVFLRLNQQVPQHSGPPFGIAQITFRGSYRSKMRSPQVMGPLLFRIPFTNDFVVRRPRPLIRRLLHAPNVNERHDPRPLAMPQIPNDLRMIRRPIRQPLPPIAHRRDRHENVLTKGSARQ